MALTWLAEGWLALNGLALTRLTLSQLALNYLALGLLAWNRLALVLLATGHPDCAAARLSKAAGLLLIVSRMDCPSPLNSCYLGSRTRLWKAGRLLEAGGGLNTTRRLRAANFWSPAERQKIVRLLEATGSREAARLLESSELVKVARVLEVVKSARVANLDVHRRELRLADARRLRKRIMADLRRSEVTSGRAPEAPSEPAAASAAGHSISRQ